MTGMPRNPVPPRPVPGRPPVQGAAAGGAAKPPQKPAGTQKKEPEMYIPPRKSKIVEPTKVHPPLLALIDVLFTLMMFFIVAAKQKVMEGEVPSSLPGEGTSAAETPVEPIRIDVIPAGESRESATYNVNGKVFNSDQTDALYAMLQARKNTYGAEAAKKVKVIIKPRQDTRWEWVVNAFNQALRAQFEEIGFAPI